MKFNELAHKVDEVEQRKALMASISEHQHVYWSVDFEATKDMTAWEADNYIAGTRDESDIEGANCVSSEIITKDQVAGLHTVAIDVDHKVVALHSTTPGHYHLYIDVPMTWEKYERLLEAMVDCGIVEEGYLEASRIRRATFLRLPWVGKT